MLPMVGLAVALQVGAAPPPAGRWCGNASQPAHAVPAVGCAGGTAYPRVPSADDCGEMCCWLGPAACATWLFGDGVCWVLQLSLIHI